MPTHDIHIPENTPIYSLTHTLIQHTYTFIDTHMYTYAYTNVRHFLLYDLHTCTHTHRQTTIAFQRHRSLRRIGRLTSSWLAPWCCAILSRKNCFQITEY